MALPIEGQELLCLDPHDGSIRWRRDREDTVYGEVSGDTCLLVGPNWIRAVSVYTGQPLWGDRMHTFPHGGLVNGHGVFQGDRYLLPDHQGHLLAIDLRDGQVSIVAKHTAPLGNLAWRHGDLLSHSALTVGRYALPSTADSPGETP